MNYKVPFVNYKKFYKLHKDEIDGTLERVLSGGDLILRDDVSRFEASVAAYLGVGHGIGTNSGTDALYLSLLAAGIGPGDEVITVAHTFLATIAVIVHCGAAPVLVDVTDDGNMDVGLAEAAVTARTRAIMPVHLNGRCCDMARVMALAAERNLIVIEDAAQALGATCDGQKAGSFGLAAGFSFYPAKGLGAFGDAGLAATDSETIARQLRLYRDHGRATKEDFTLFGFNSRLDNIQAALLNMKFAYFPQWIERRREIAGRYAAGLSGLPGLALPPSPEPGRYYDTYQNYVIRARERDKLSLFLKNEGIETMISWPRPHHLQPGLKLGHFHLPVTERLSGEVLSLPMYPELDDEQVATVIDAVRRFYGA